jgi:hypothetical protein
MRRVKRYDFRRDYPRIFGGVLDAVASALRLLPAIKLAELERMADFTRWGEAVAQAVGWSPGTFVAVYRGNRRAASVVAMEDSDLAKALMRLNDFHGPFKGTVTQLLQALADYTGSGRLTIPGWPKPRTSRRPSCAESPPCSASSASRLH